eukprot:587989-Rhodomonas_salina.3
MGSGYSGSTNGKAWSTSMRWWHRSTTLKGIGQSTAAQRYSKAAWYTDVSTRHGVGSGGEIMIVPSI